MDNNSIRDKIGNDQKYTIFRFNVRKKMYDVIKEILTSSSELSLEEVKEIINNEIDSIFLEINNNSKSK